MGHRIQRNVDGRDRKMPDRKMPDDDDRAERDRFVHSQHVRRVVHDDDDEREERDHFVHDEEVVRELIESMTPGERARFIDERTRMFDDAERGRLFGGSRALGVEENRREHPRSHRGRSHAPERHRRR